MQTKVYVGLTCLIIGIILYLTFCNYPEQQDVVQLNEGLCKLLGKNEGVLLTPIPSVKEHEPCLSSGSIYADMLLEEIRISIRLKERKRSYRERKYYPMDPKISYLEHAYIRDDSDWIAKHPGLKPQPLSFETWRDWSYFYFLIQEDFNSNWVDRRYSEYLYFVEEWQKALQIFAGY